MLNIVRNALIIVAALIGVVFAYFNTARIQLDYLFGQVEMPLVLAMAIALLVGIALGVLVGLPYTLRTRAHLSATRRRLQHSDTEIKNLRNQPINDA